jgi:N-acetylmuramoyl-L-alanine amidase
MYSQLNSGFCLGSDMRALLTLSFGDVSLTRNQMQRVSLKGRLAMRRAVRVTTFCAR